MPDIPEYVYKTVADDRAERWGYTETLDAADLAKFIRVQARDENLRADIEVAIAAYLRVTS